MPALICTTVPPAKSSTPAFARKPPPHTQCAMGAYTKSDQSTMNRSSAENFMRSTNAPKIRAGVMIAKVAWKVKNTVSGIVSVRLSFPTLP